MKENNTLYFILNVKCSNDCRTWQIMSSFFLSMLKCKYLWYTLIGMKRGIAMSKSTRKKPKKQKYSTRIEKNKKIYYKNNSSIRPNNVKKNSNNKIVLFILAISIFFNAFFLLRTNSLTSSIDDLNSTIDKNEEEYSTMINNLKNEYTNYLFLGDSITDYYNLDTYYGGLPVVNSGIEGNTTEDILNDMKNRVYNYNPSKVFLLIGTNDLIHDMEVEEIVSNIEKIISEINNNEPQSEIYVESIYPVNDNLNEDMVNVRNNEDIMKINEKIKAYCEANDCTYINIYDILLDDDGNFSEEYTDDGLHPNSRGYEVITEELKKYLD